MQEGIPEAISFFIKNYIQAVYLFVLLRVGDDLYLAKACVEKIFKDFFLSIISIYKIRDLEHILINISEHICSQALLQTKKYATHPYSISYIDPEDWKKIHILRDLPFNYHWPLAKALTSTSGLLQSPPQEEILLRAEKMYEEALWEYNLKLGFKKKFYYTQEEIHSFLCLLLKQDCISAEKRVFSFFCSFGASLLAVNAIVYFSLLYHFPQKKSDFSIFFLSFGVLIVFSLVLVKCFTWIKKAYVKKNWNKNRNKFYSMVHKF